MPELPEVERVRLTLAAHLLGQAVQHVRLHRRDIITGSNRPAALLAGATVHDIRRHGKQLALIAPDGRCVAIHLGMTGSLRYSQQPPNVATDKHIHVVWTLAGGGMLAFRDPRRFGGLWTFPSFDALCEARWSSLGPDALAIVPARLYAALTGTHRPLKAALLDQGILAGLGNIYVDELLFQCGLDPRKWADSLALPRVQAMVRAMRTLLRRAIAAGGSSISDYTDGNGEAGSFQNRHQVYGRSGKPCRRCGKTLVGFSLAGRTTVRCPRCQK